MSRPQRLARYALAAVAAAAGSAGRPLRRRRGDCRVFILEYHDVTTGSDESEGSVCAARLRSHVRYLKRHFRCVGLSEAVERLGHSGALREDLVVVTLDDGYAGNYEAAWDILRAERVPATIFVTTGFLDGEELWFDRARRLLATAQRESTPLPSPLQAQLQAVCGSSAAAALRNGGLARLKYAPRAVRNALLEALAAACQPSGTAKRALRWAQVRELHTAGIEIGCHTVSHPILSTLSALGQTEEIERARDRIAAETGTVPVLFAYPNGDRADFTPTTVQLVRAAGFRAACTTLRGSNRPGADLFTLRRIGVGADPIFVLAARLAGAFDAPLRRWRARGAQRPATSSARLGAEREESAARL